MATNHQFTQSATQGNTQLCLVFADLVAFFPKQHPLPSEYLLNCTDELWIFKIQSTPVRFLALHLFFPLLHVFLCYILSKLPILPPPEHCTVLVCVISKLRWSLPDLEKKKKKSTHKTLFLLAFNVSLYPLYFLLLHLLCFSQILFPTAILFFSDVAFCVLLVFFSYMFKRFIYCFLFLIVTQVERVLDDTLTHLVKNSPHFSNLFWDLFSCIETDQSQSNMTNF